MTALRQFGLPEVEIVGSKGDPTSQVNVMGQTQPGSSPGERELRFSLAVI